MFADVCWGIIKENQLEKKNIRKLMGVFRHIMGCNKGKQNEEFVMRQNILLISKAVLNELRDTPAKENTPAGPDSFIN